MDRLAFVSVVDRREIAAARFRRKMRWQFKQIDAEVALAAAFELAGSV
jgi:hypothetical protein